ncbi:helix-turn-helix domain-containing protein [Paenibacillus macerans]|uniref:helix-turn-helix domain-containing protein n=1 Tax=Paenibacillus macerans TaxID=44252 RepID=UPI002041C4CB|nr:helix-turn-helix domain-containing protein [Paenibacillus macerans]MCM3699169.1 transcriptional regulator [Paenibacillus macerans]
MGIYIIRRESLSNSKVILDKELNTIGDRIRHSRQLKEMTIKELASIIQVSQNTISNIERNAVIPSLPHLRKLSDTLDQPISYLGCFETLPETTLGQRFKKARFYHGLMRIETAEKLMIDVRTINNWESDRKMPSSVNMPAVEKFIEILK